MTNIATPAPITSAIADRLALQAPQVAQQLAVERRMVDVRALR